MKTVNYTEVRQNLATLLNSVTDDAEELVITRAGHESVVVVSLADWNATKETEYLLGNPAMADHLRKGIAEANAGGGQERELIDPDAMRETA